MATTNPSFQAIIEPDCHIPVGMRTLDQQRRCMQAENKLWRVGTVIASIAAFAYGTSSLPDRKQIIDEVGRPRTIYVSPSQPNNINGGGSTTSPSSLTSGGKYNICRGLKYGVGTLIAGQIVEKGRMIYREGQWRAETALVRNAMENKAEAEFLNARLAADNARISSSSSSSFSTLKW